MTIPSCLAWLSMACMFLPQRDAEISPGQSIPLANGYAHNDYWHKRPLLDALENGYTHIEVDIFHIGNEFIVAHIFPFLKPGKTLENLYLKPLYEHISRNRGLVYANYHQPIVLMIDIKMNGAGTYHALKKLLEKYKDILTVYENGIIIQKQVTVILSGSKPYASLSNEDKRYAFIDEDLKTITGSKNPSSVCPVASCDYRSMLRWNGNGPIPGAEKEKLISFVTLAHRQGKKVRLWASPETEAVWRELLACGVDLINTDKLVVLRQFLLANATMQKIPGVIASIGPQAK